MITEKNIWRIQNTCIYRRKKKYCFKVIALIVIRVRTTRMIISMIMIKVTHYHNHRWYTDRQTIRCWSPNVTRSVVMVSWFTRNYCACAPMLYISELCEDCAIANKIDYEIWLCVSQHPWQRTRDHGVWRLTSTAHTDKATCTYKNQSMTRMSVMSSAGRPTALSTITKVTSPAWGTPAAPTLANVAVILEKKRKVIRTS